MVFPLYTITDTGLNDERSYVLCDNEMSETVVPLPSKREKVPASRSEDEVLSKISEQQTRRKLYIPGHRWLILVTAVAAASLPMFILLNNRFNIRSSGRGRYCIRCVYIPLEESLLLS